MVHHQTLQRLIMRAMTQGAKPVSPITWEWDIAGRCQDKLIHEIVSRPEGKPYVTIAPGTPHTLALRLKLRCRRCDRCRKARERLWTRRAVVEVRQAPRTWFATFTFSPAVQYRFKTAARLAMSRQGIDFDALEPGDRFRQLSTIAGKELTLFFKRLRKNTQAPLRYLLVAEPHKSGDPHFNALIHERDPGYPVRHAALTQCWSLGFSKFKLVDGDPKAASYVCKYLNKSTLARVRASVGYGRTTIVDAINVEKPDPPDNFTLKRRLKQWVDTIQRRSVPLIAEARDIQTRRDLPAADTTSLEF